MSFQFRLWRLTIDLVLFDLDTSDRNVQVRIEVSW